MSACTKHFDVGCRTWYTQEGFGAAGDAHPCHVESALDAFDPPKMVKKLKILDHRGGIEHSINWRVDLVLECEDIPANLAMRILKHACVEPPEDVWGIVLGVGRAQCRFQGSSEVVSI